MGDRRLDTWINDQGQRQQSQYYVAQQYSGPKPSKAVSRQIQANNRRAVAEVQQVTRAMADNAPPNSITYNYINITHKYSK